ncbi:hypothetical protein EGW08_005649, partial [Elysia chlorotica]
VKKERFNLRKSNNKCRSINGYLLELDDGGELKYLSKVLQRKEAMYYRVYTGGNDVIEEGKFFYINSGKPLLQGHWTTNTPDDTYHRENCVEIFPWLTTINDVPCLHNFHFICE